LTGHAERGILTSGEIVIINSNESFASKPFEERLRLGKLCEAQMFENLKSIGYYLKPATKHEDIELKIDGYLSNDQHLYIPFQSKYRQTGIDIGLDVWEPWFGPNDPRNGVGRDYKSKAELYVTQVNDQLYVMHRTGLHLIVDQTFYEWKNHNHKFHFGDGISRGTFNPSIQGVQLKLKVDESNRKTKIIVYISPTSVDENYRLVRTVKPIII